MSRPGAVRSLAAGVAALLLAGCGASTGTLHGSAATTGGMTTVRHASALRRSDPQATSNQSHLAASSSGRTTASRTHLQPFVTGTSDFNRSYDVTGKMTVHYFGSDHDVPPPRSAVSNWDSVIATVFVRGETALGQLGFSLGFSDTQCRMFHQLILFVPASRDAASPKDGYINMPLKHALPWLDSGLNAPLTSATQDGTWLVTLQWQAANQLLISIKTAPGRSAPRYLSHGAITITAAGPRGNEWSTLQLGLDTHSSSADVHGALTLAPAS
jgi:hypothetical protein